MSYKASKLLRYFPSLGLIPADPFALSTYDYESKRFVSFHEKYLVTVKPICQFFFKIYYILFRNMIIF